MIREDEEPMIEISGRPLGFISSRTQQSSNLATTSLRSSRETNGQPCSSCRKKSPQCRGGTSGNCTSCPRCLKSSRNCAGASRYYNSRSKYVEKDGSRCTTFSSSRQQQETPPFLAAQPAVSARSLPLQPLAPPVYTIPVYYPSYPQPYHQLQFYEMDYSSVYNYQFL
jgi:hypothetical protein